MVTNIDGKMLRKMFLSGAKNLETKKEWINELNVFPVPDGDTGTNMTLTIMSAAKEVSALEEPTMKDLAKAISSGSLRGARGNSGVILSQIFRGFTKEIKQFDTIDAVTFANACDRAVETAYKAVMKPKEGTILTVAKGMAEKARELVMETDDLDAIISGVIEEGDYVLSQTPEMLPVLKQAGVVDSGGQGLMQVMKGAYDAFLGRETDFSSIENQECVQEEKEEFAYHTEFVIMVNGKFTASNETEFKNYLGEIGTCVINVEGSGMVKADIHTNDPGLAIQKALTYGYIKDVKLENVQGHDSVDAQASAAVGAEESAPRKNSGFVAVSVGKGMDEIFKGLGVDYIITGGQTMNPSTEDMLNAIDNVNADNVYILPNNKNIILAAEQAKSLVKDKNVIVIPTKTIPQGISAVINYVESKTAEENIETMSSEITNVKTGQITYAVRDTIIDGKEIHENDIMGIGDNGIISVGRDVSSTALDMISQLIDDDSEILSIYYGSDTSDEDAGNLVSKLSELYPDVDIEVNDGGQPIYYYIISVE